MARSHHELEQEAQNLEPEQEPELNPELLRNQTVRSRFSLSNDGDEFTIEYFRSAFQENPTQLFKRINEVLVRLNTIKTKIISLESEALAQRQDTAEIIIQNEELRVELLQALRQNRQSTPLYNRPQKSTKLPDPPIFTDGKGMKFSDWVSRIRNKLRVNSDHYPTDSIQLAYIEGRVEGEAARHISPRLAPDSADPYRTIQDLLDHLSEIYEDPNRTFEAKNEFKKLFMSKNQTFHEFHTKFLQLSNEAKIIKNDLKYELYSKLSFALQKAVISHFNSDISFQEFAKQCGIYDQSLRAIEARESRTKKSGTLISPTNTKTVVQPATSTSNPRSRLSYNNELKQQLSRAGKCFICHEAGHLMRDCPHCRTEVKVIEEGPAGNNSP
jgi:hypothetical protein